MRQSPPEPLGRIPYVQYRIQATRVGALYTCLENDRINGGSRKAPIITAHEHGGRNNMAHYSLADVLTQEIPDIVLVDIALHWQANDNWPSSMGMPRVSPPSAYCPGKQSMGEPVWGALRQFS
jgi:hypothetical protein